MPRIVRFSRSSRDPEVDLQVLVSETHECDSNTKEKRRSNLFLTLLYALFAFAILLTTTLLVTYFVTFDRNLPSPYRRTPMVTVNEVVIDISRAVNMTCRDHDSCDDLRRRIEQQNGMKYNFVIGSGMELFVGAGFKFHTEQSNETALYIKVFMDGTPGGAHSDRCWCLMDNGTITPNNKRILIRISEIVQQGTACGKIKRNSTISLICGDTFGKCADNESGLILFHLIYNKFYNEKYMLENNRTWVVGEDYKKRFDHYDPDPELGTILMNDFRLLTCERPIHGRRTVKGKVITLKSVVPVTCEPFRPVDRVRVDFERAPPLRCGDEQTGTGTETTKGYIDGQSGIPCANLSRLIERDHGAAGYNFVLGTHHDLYVGLGYSCRAPQDPNGTAETLRIKVLRAAESGDLQLHRLYGLINEGSRCGWISSNYSLALDCNCSHVDYIDFVAKLPSMKRLHSRYELMDRPLNETHRGKVIHHSYQWKMCNHTAGKWNPSPRAVFFPRTYNASFTDIDKRGAVSFPRTYNASFTDIDKRGAVSFPRTYNASFTDIDEHDSSDISSDKLVSTWSEEVYWDSSETGSLSDESYHDTLP